MCPDAYLELINSMRFLTFSSCSAESCTSLSSVWGRWGKAVPPRLILDEVELELKPESVIGEGWYSGGNSDTPGLGRGGEKYHHTPKQLPWCNLNIRHGLKINNFSYTYIPTCEIELLWCGLNCENPGLVEFTVAQQNRSQGLDAVGGSLDHQQVEQQALAVLIDLWVLVVET